MLKRLLIANRGEIACRVIRTAQRLGVRTIAIYSEADRGARHVRLADEAHLIGPSPAAESYLQGERIIELARRIGAEAIHPGYGFLSENADFAQACADHELIFVGPPADAIRAMGIKNEAKQIMAEAGVPVAPGYHADNFDLKVVTNEARKIGYPVMVKAVAGGGGRGLRVVARELDLIESVQAARREAEASFGDDRLMLEKYVADPRHIEIQVFSDNHGNAVHLFERDCSVQRKHQKIIEEAPAPGLPRAVRAQLGEAAVTAAQAINYVGAGTVEFIMDRADQFYFIEMNTRLQVEHPVTEAITGHDLVEWQLRVASGEPLPCTQDELSMSGHAIEARLYAEDPTRGFLPSTGHIHYLRWPTDDPELRIETGVETGDEISPYYDAMIAKLIVWDEGRRGAATKLEGAVRALRLAGLATNRDLLIRVLRHPSFLAADVDTGFIDRHKDQLLARNDRLPDRALAAAAVHVLLDRERAARSAVGDARDPGSPWSSTSAWRLNQDPTDELHFIDGAKPITVPVRFRTGGYVLSLPDGALDVAARRLDDTTIEMDFGDDRSRVTVVSFLGGVSIWLEDHHYRVTFDDPMRLNVVSEDNGNRLTAPMPGRVTQVLVDDGAEVARGTALVVIEAMKMEHTIAAPDDGRVEKVKFSVGDWVDEGVTLLDFAVETA